MAASRGFHGSIPAPLTRAPLYPRNDYDRHVFRMQKNTQGSRGTWDKVKKKSVMLLSLDTAHLHLSQAQLGQRRQNPGITAPVGLGWKMGTLPGFGICCRREKFLR